MTIYSQLAVDNKYYLVTNFVHYPVFQKQHSTLRNDFVPILRWNNSESPIQLGLTEQAILNIRTTYVILTTTAYHQWHQQIMRGVQ